MKAIKKIILAGALCAGFGAATKAQALGIGPLAGVNLANSDVGGHSSHEVTNWAFGARLELGVNPLLNILVDPMFVKSGADFDASPSFPSGTGDFLFLEVPALLSLKLTLLNVGVYGFIGPDFIFPTDASGTVEKSRLKSFVLAGDVGAGVAFGVAPLIDLSLDARYTHGFTDLIDQASGDIRNWRTRDVRLTFGVLFHSPGV